MIEPVSHDLNLPTPPPRSRIVVRELSQAFVKFTNTVVYSVAIVVVTLLALLGILSIHAQHYATCRYYGVPMQGYEIARLAPDIGPFDRRQSSRPQRPNTP